jgi:hypothetical protein
VRIAEPDRASHALIHISDRLRPRDYTIAALLDEHTTLTTDQLTAVLFGNPITCRHRLHLLRRLGFVDRFIRTRPGAPNPVCWLPGPLSARFMALARGENPPSARTLRERQDRVFASPHLEHLLAENQFFISLLARARTHAGAGLVRWWSERTTAAAFGQRVRPDGHGVWGDGDTSVGWFLELDRGTEALTALVAKINAYRRLRFDGGPDYPVLFVLPSTVREQNLHRRLADGLDPGVTIATTSPEAGADPAGPVWRLFGNGRHRLTLSDLPSSHGEPGPLNPGPPTVDQHPLRLLDPP